MAPRTDLQTLLENVLGSQNVYFQAPPEHEMVFPCIVYNRSNIRAKFGDNVPYIHMKEYTVTVIDANPDSETPDKIAALPRCIFDRGFKSDNLNHDVFNIIF